MENVKHGPGESELNELRLKHGSINVFAHEEIPECIVVCKQVSRVEYKRFRQKSADRANLVDANEQLVRSCVVWPDKEKLAAMIDAYPAIDDVWGGKILEAAGLTDKVSKKAG